MIGESRRIDGWKTIAAYLGRDRTTAMRWAAKHAMPVHHLPGSGSSVYAFARELDAWLTNGGATAAPAAQDSARVVVTHEATALRRSRRYVVAAALVGATGATAFFALPLLRRNPAPPPAGRDIPLPADPEVAAAYVQAREDWASRTGPGLRRAIAGFAQVIARDPGFAPAYGSLADAYLLIREFGALPQRDAYARAEAAARAGLAVDPDSVEGHRALGFIAYWRYHDTRRTGAEFSRALALDPRNGQTQLWLGNILVDNGQPREGLAHLSVARLLDAGSRAVQADYAWALWASGDLVHGRAMLQRMAERDPDFVSPAFYLSLIALVEGDEPAYLANQRRRATARTDGQLAAQIEAASRAYAARGRSGLLSVLIDAARADRDAPDHGWEALLVALSGDHARLLQLLEAADAQNERWGYVPPLWETIKRYSDDSRLMRLWRRRFGDAVVIAPQTGRV